MKKSQQASKQALEKAQEEAQGGLRKVSRVCFGMSATTGLDGMSVAPRLSRAVQKLERWAVQRLR